MESPTEQELFLQLLRLKIHVPPCTVSREDVESAAKTAFFSTHTSLVRDVDARNSYEREPPAWVEHHAHTLRSV